MIPNENKLELAVDVALCVCVVCGTSVKINYFRWNLKAKEQVTFHEKQLRGMLKEDHAKKQSLV